MGVCFSATAVANDAEQIKATSSISTNSPINITVDAATTIAPIPRLLFGTNYNPKMESGQNIKKLFTDTGLTLIRFPGGSGNYDWKRRMVAQKENGKVVFKKSNLPFHNDFEGFVDFAREVNCKIFMEVNIGTGNAKDAGELVKWNKEHGRPIIYFGLGNEPQGMPDGARDFGGYKSAIEYVEEVHEFSKAMRAADSEVKIGICTWEWRDIWLGEVAENINPASFDFIDYHWYPCHKSPASEKLTFDQIGLFTAANAYSIIDSLKKMRSELQKRLGERAKQVEIVIGEFDASNFGQQQNSSLAEALFYAEAYGQFVVNKISAAAHYSLQSAPFGLVPGFREGHYGGNPWNNVTYRPKGFAIRLWSKHMGGKLVKCHTENSDTYDVSKWTTPGWHRMNYRGSAPYISSWAGLSADGKTLSIMIINRDEKQSRSVNISISNFTCKTGAIRFEITGPYYLASNDLGQPGQDPGPGFSLYQSHTPPPPVRVKLDQYPITKPEDSPSNFTCMTKPHSVTLIKLIASDN